MQVQLNSMDQSNCSSRCFTIKCSKYCTLFHLLSLKLLSKKCTKCILATKNFKVWAHILVKHFMHLKHKNNLLFVPFNFGYIFRLTFILYFKFFLLLLVPLLLYPWRLKLHIFNTWCSWAYWKVRFGLLVVLGQSRWDVKYSFISKWSFQQRWKTYASYLETS